MLAHLQKLVVLCLCATAIAWAVTLVAIGRPVSATLGALFVLFGYAIVLAVEFGTLHFVQQGNAAPHPRGMQLLSAWWGEVLITPRIFLWRQPFRSNAERDSLPTEPQGRRGVLLVHGFVCNRGLWNPWLRALRAMNIPFIAINLEPIFGSIDDYVDRIEVAVARVEAATGMPIVLVGHSMGGVAIRAWFARFDAQERVHRVITIGSPHHGTWLARFSHTIIGHQLRINSPWLARLATSETPAQYGRFTCFFGHCDNIVFPAALGTLPGAHNIHMPATAHVHLAFRPEVFAEVCRWLR